jgi:putative DNA primase/helicase
VQHLNLASASENIFVYKYWIRQTIGKQKAENMIYEETKKFFWSQKAISNNDFMKIFSFVLLESYNDQLKENLMQHNTHELCLDDCIYNISTHETRQYKKNDYKFQKLPFDSNVFATYTPPVKRLHFLNEITEWTEQQEQVIELLQEYIWWLFIANTQYQKALLIYWSGANGKWVLLSVIKEILWHQNCSSVWLHEINKDQYLYNLIGKLCNIDTDMQQNTQLDSWIIKKLISWESISAKALYKQPIEFTPFTRLIIATNELPYLKTIDNSVRRRFLFLHLKQSFLWRENTNLVNEILTEKNAIFARVIQWLERLIKKNAFIIPSSLENEIEEFIKDHDTVAIFLEETGLTWNKWYISDLYDAYKRSTLYAWQKPLTKQQLWKRLIQNGFEKKKDSAWWFFMHPTQDSEWQNDKMTNTF